MFQHGSRAVLVAAPADMSQLSDHLNVASSFCPQLQRLTLPTLRLACYRANSEDFRWSMTPDEVRWHAFCITTRKLIELAPDGNTESIINNGVDGVVQFTGKRAVFDWQCNDRMFGGYIHFKESGGTMDPVWVRTVCQSLKMIEREGSSGDGGSSGSK